MRIEELEAARGKVHQELNTESSELETLRAKLTTKKLLTEEEYGIKPWLRSKRLARGTSKSSKSK